jgi:hypothetical protein
LAGNVPLLVAARLARRRQKAARITVEEMATAWRRWPPSMRAAFGQSVGAAELWDHSIVPTISVEHGDRAYAVAAE